eukprot:2213688-Pyramimonas_sp.AAC.1
MPANPSPHVLQNGVAIKRGPKTPSCCYGILLRSSTNAALRNSARAAGPHALNASATPHLAAPANARRFTGRPSPLKPPI